jgi:hypothetical protein
MSNARENMESESNGEGLWDTVIQSSFILEQTFGIANDATFLEGVIPPPVLACDSPECEIASGIPEVDNSPVSASSSASSFLIRGTPSVIRSLPIHQQTPSDEQLRDANAWRQRQRNKLLGALRRQIEWIVLHDGPMSICDLLAIERIRDLTEQQSDVIEALSRSVRVHFRPTCDSDTAENTLNLIIELV